MSESPMKCQGAPGKATQQDGPEDLEGDPTLGLTEGTGRMLLGVLRDRSTAGHRRLLAAELASNFTVIKERLVDALLSILRCENALEEQRGRVAISLGPVLEQADTEGLENPEEVPISEQMIRQVQRSLRTRFSDTEVPKGVRPRILDASVRAPQEWHGDAIRTAYGSSLRESCGFRDIRIL